MLGTISRRLLFCSTFLAMSVGAASAAPLGPAAPLVHEIPSDLVTTQLVRDRPAALATSVDQGVVGNGIELHGVHLALKRPADREEALEALIAAQQQRGSAYYHRWLAPSDLRNYGPAQADIASIVTWLTRHGLSVERVAPSGMGITFGGPAGRIAAAFHTSLHQVLRSGEAHVANVAAPSIPRAFAPVVTGVTLSNFFPKPAMKRVAPELTVKAGASTFYAVTPSDFATIYNIKPLRGSFNFFNQPITGTGVSVAVIEQTLIRTADWQRFRSAFGLSSYAGKLTQTHPGNCASPGFTFDEGEAALDAEWASASAPDANVIEASCAGSAPFGFGVYNALENLVEFGTPASIFSISYGGSEIANGFSFIDAWTNLLQEGAAEGKSIFVSSGDSGSSANPAGSIDTNGLDINGLSDSIYNVSVGGTDFYDTALGQNSTYWNSTNSSIFGSAKSYVPEIAWDNACSNSVIWKYHRAPGAIAFCNNSASDAVTQNGVGGGGGQSHFYAKPVWQKAIGMPNDGVRDQPDVSLFAANGIWNHFYVFCMSDPAAGGSPCQYTTASQVFGNAAGGTSFAAPALAGIQALVEEIYGSAPLGNPAPEYYKIARAQYATSLGFSRCDATLGNTISPACVFRYVTHGDNTEPCVSGSPDCVSSSASTRGLGVLGTTLAGKSIFAYPAGAGYDLSTGLGTVNVTNLLYNYY